MEDAADTDIEMEDAADTDIEMEDAADTDIEMEDAADTDGEDTLKAISEYLQNKTDTDGHQYLDCDDHQYLDCDDHQYLDCDYDVEPSCLSQIREGITSLSFNTANYGTHVLHLVDRLPKSIEVLNLGHDGIIVCNNTDESAISVFERLIRSLPKLRKIYHCGYYSEFSSSNIKAAARACSRQLKVVKIY